MAASVRSTSTGDASLTYEIGPKLYRADITAPSTIESGDVLLCVVAQEGLATLSAYSGWNQLYQANYDAAYDVTSGVYWRECDGTEDGTTMSPCYSTQSGSWGLVYICYAVRDAPDPSTYPPQCGTAFAGSSINPNPPSLTVSGSYPGDLWFVPLAMRADVGFWDYPADFDSDQQMLVHGGLDNIRAACASRSYSASTLDPGAYDAGTTVHVVNTVAFVSVAQTVTLGLLSPLTLYAPTVKPTVTLPLLSAATLYAPAVAREEVVTLGLLEPLTLFEPTVIPDQPVTLPLLEPLIVYAPAVAHGDQYVTVPLLGAATIHAPTVVAETLLTLPLIEATSLTAPAVTYGTQYMTLPLIGAATLWEPTVQPTVSIPFLEPVTLWTPTLTPAVVLPLLAPAALYSPTLSISITLPLIAGTTLYGMSVARCQWLTVTADVAATGWDTAPTPGQALYAQVDETPVSDTDYIWAPVT